MPVRPLEFYRTMDVFRQLGLETEEGFCLCPLCHSDSGVSVNPDEQGNAILFCGTKGCGPQGIWEELARLSAARASGQPAPTNGKHPEKQQRQSKYPSGVTGWELSSMEFPPQRHAVNGLIGEGLNLLAGSPKSGKSWCALDIGLAVASENGKALGCLEVEHGEVLYLALEDSKRRLRYRQDRVLQGEPAPAGIHFFTEWPRLGEGGETLLDEWIKDHPRCRLVMIDTLAKIRSANRANGNVYEEDYRQIGDLKRIADKNEVSMLVLHHLRKQDAADPVDSVSGSMGITGSADAILVLKRVRGRMEAVLHVTGRDMDDQEIAMEWESSTCTWKYLGGAKEHRAGADRQAILDAIKTMGEGISFNQIAEAIGKSANSVRYLASQMSQSKEVMISGGKLYLQLPNDNGFHKRLFP